jgi:hypothetical protein
MPGRKLKVLRKSFEDPTSVLRQSCATTRWQHPGHQPTKRPYYATPATCSERQLNAYFTYLAAVARTNSFSGSRSMPSIFETSSEGMNGFVT